MIARWLACLAKFGKSLLIFSPLTFVSMDSKNTPLALAGLGSKVSIWLGPPLIHKRITLYCGFALSLAGGCATALAEAFRPGGSSRCPPAGSSPSAGDVPKRAAAVNSAATTTPAATSLTFERPMVNSAPFANDAAAADAPHAEPREI